MKKGRCNICNKVYLDNGMTRHVKTCLEKEKGAKSNKNNTLDSIYLIKVQAKYNSGYYLYLLVDGCVLLSEMDQYIRDIWVECCGHLSSFNIGGINHERYPDTAWGNSEDMNIEIDEVLHCGMSFSYIYDYGSTTELELKVLENYESLFEDKGIRLVGRNMPREYECDYCNNKAKFQFEDMDSCEQGVVCNSCMKKMQSEGDEIYFSDMINSPRAGVCGYNGPADDIMFMKHKKTKNRKRKKLSKTQDDKIIFLEKLVSGELTEDDMEEQIDLNDFFSRITNLAKYRQRSMPPFILERCKLDGHTLKDYLGLLRKNELDFIRKNLNVEKTSGLKKDQLIDRLNQFLLNNIENILTFLPFTSYKVLMEIHKTGEAIWGKSEGIPEILADLRNKGLLFTVCEDEEEYEWIIPDDIKVILNKLKEDEKFQKIRTFSDKVGKMIISIFYYWGIVKKYNLINETARLLNMGIDDEFTVIFEGIFKNIEGTYLKNERIGKNIYYYMFSEYADKQILSTEWQQSDYPLITKDMIPDGDEGWLSLVLHNPYFKWTYDVMGRADNNEIDSDEEACELVATMAQVSFNTRPGTDVNQLAKELEMQDEVFEAPLMRELLNNVLLYTPNYWIKGNSISGEIHVNNEKHMGWTPQTMPQKKPVKRLNNDSSKAAASSWKIGRNDPCPCGSGKKFKKCCGK